MAKQFRRLFKCKICSNEVFKKGGNVDLENQVCGNCVFYGKGPLSKAAVQKKNGFAGKGNPRVSGSNTSSIHPIDTRNTSPKSGKVLEAEIDYHRQVLEAVERHRQTLDKITQLNETNKTKGFLELLAETKGMTLWTAP